METIEQCHTLHISDEFKNDMVAYHYWIKTNGVIQKGRPEFVCSAAQRGHNSRSIAICLATQAPYSPSQMNSLRDQILYIMKRHPKARVMGHNDLTTLKDCPEFDVKYWYETGLLTYTPMAMRRMAPDSSGDVD